MKIASNAAAYGIPIELNLAEHRRKVGLTVYRPDGNSYHTEARRTEEPGTWFHPLLATLVAAGGRLLLATAIALFRDAGGSYVFCDTDSVFTTATPTGKGNTGVPTLSWKQAISIAERFESLNPYHPAGIPESILELEPENRDPDASELREVHCFSLAAKRYVLYTPGSDGRPQIIGHSGKRKRSEHGLGHLVAPRDMKPETFYDRWWEHILCAELGVNDPEPDWLDKDAPPPESAASSHPPNATRASSPSSSGTTAALATTNLTRSQAADRSSSKTAGYPFRPTATTSTNIGSIAKPRPSPRMANPATLGHAARFSRRGFTPRDSRESAKKPTPSRTPPI
jgi:hypothetical protein